MRSAAHDQDRSPVHADHPAIGSTAKAVIAPVRMQRACSSCSAQKVRCDGAKPCARCVALDRSHLCEYLPSLRGKTRKKKPVAESTLDHDSARKGLLHGDVVGQNRQRQADLELWTRDDSIAGPSNIDLWRPSGADPVDGTQAFATRPVAERSLTTLPLPGDAPNPLSALAEASAATFSSRAGPLNTLDTSAGQLDGASYYSRIERLPRNDAPHVMTLISVSEAEQLFDIYFTSLHPHFPILDREHSSPIAIAKKNNFLFNAICCVAARGFHVTLWERLRQSFSRFETSRIPTEKNIEVVQAHLIYAQWNLNRPKHFEDDTTWLRVGLAVRTAIDINIHRVALIHAAEEETPSWETRNVLRTWLSCYVVDRTLSAQLGKPPSVRGENAIRLYFQLLKRHSEKPSIDDIWVAGLAEWTMLLTRCMDVFRNEASDYLSASARSFASQTSGLPDISHMFSRQFRQWRDSTTALARACSANSRIEEITTTNLALYEGYAQVVIYSFGLQRATDGATLDLPVALVEHQRAAVSLLRFFDQACERGTLHRGWPDFVFTVLTYAAVSALKTTQISSAVYETDGSTIFGLARKAADTLARSAMTPDHLPASQNILLLRLVETYSKKQAPTRDTTTIVIPSLHPETTSGSNALSAISPTLLDSLNALNPLGSTSVPTWVPEIGFTDWFGANNLGGEPTDSQLDPFALDQGFEFTHDSMWSSLLHNMDMRS